MALVKYLWLRTAKIRQNKAVTTRARRADGEAVDSGFFFSSRVAEQGWFTCSRVRLQYCVSWDIEHVANPQSTNNTNCILKSVEKLWQILSILGGTQHSPFSQGITVLSYIHRLVPWLSKKKRLPIPPPPPHLPRVFFISQKHRYSHYTVFETITKFASAMFTVSEL